MIVDEDRVTAGLLGDLAQSESYHVTIIDDLNRMNLQCGAISPDLVFINHESPGGRISEWLGRSSLPANADVVLIGEVLTPGEIVQAFRWGVADVLFKPVDTLRVQHLLRHRINRLAGDAAGSQRSDFHGLPTGVGHLAGRGRGELEPDGELRAMVLVELLSKPHLVSYEMASLLPQN